MDSNAVFFGKLKYFLAKLGIAFLIFIAFFSPQTVDFFMSRIIAVVITLSVAKGLQFWLRWFMRKTTTTKKKEKKKNENIVELQKKKEEDQEDERRKRRTRKVRVEEL